MKKALAIPRPYELITSLDLVRQVKKRLGSFHPVVRHLEYSLMANRSSLPENLRDLVPDDWLWFESYHFWVLSCLSRSGEVVPACWIRTSELHRLALSGCEAFALPPDAMRRHFAAVLGHWRKVYPRLEEDGSISVDPPCELGHGWFELLQWQETEEWEQRLLQTPVRPQLSWIPLFRFQDINRVSTILAEDCAVSSAFGSILVRDIRDQASRIRDKYGVSIRRKKRTSKESKLVVFRHARCDILRHLCNTRGYSLRQASRAICATPRLPETIEKKLVAYGNMGIEETSWARRLTNELQTNTEIITIVVSLLKQYSSQDISKRVFRADMRTLQRDWESLSSPP